MAVFTAAATTNRKCGSIPSERRPLFFSFWQVVHQTPNLLIFQFVYGLIVWLRRRWVRFLKPIPPSNMNTFLFQTLCVRLVPRGCAWTAVRPVPTKLRLDGCEAGATKLCLDGCEVVPWKAYSDYCGATDWSGWRTLACSFRKTTSTRRRRHHQHERNVLTKYSFSFSHYNMIRQQSYGRNAMSWKPLPCHFKQALPQAMTLDSQFNRVNIN